MHAAENTIERFPLGQSALMHLRSRALTGPASTSSTTSARWSITCRGISSDR